MDERIKRVTDFLLENELVMPQRIDSVGNDFTLIEFITNTPINFGPVIAVRGAKSPYNNFTDFEYYTNTQLHLIKLIPWRSILTIEDQVYSVELDESARSIEHIVPYSWNPIGQPLAASRRGAYRLHSNGYYELSGLPYPKEIQGVNELHLYMANKSNMDELVLGFLRNRK